jgi:hypothetical protein
MDMNVDKDEGNKYRKAIIRSTDYDRPKTTGECGVLSATWAA